MRRYRRKPLEIHSTFSKADVVMAEEEIKDFIDIDCTTEQAQELLSRICEVMFDLNPYEEDEVAYTKKGTRCIIHYEDDVEGYYCQVRKDNESDWIDDFVIHSYEVDCTDWDEVVKYAVDYVESITEF